MTRPDGRALAEIFKKFSELGLSADHTTKIPTSELPWS